MSNRTKQIKDEWWGFSPEHGWVVLDRKIATNCPGKGGKLIFLCCKDWTRYEEDRKRWEPPYYYFSDRYLETLNEIGALEAQHALNDLKDKYKHKKEEFYSSVVQDRHRQFLEDAGRIAPETRKARKKNRASYCWNCKQPVDNSIDLECSACGWIICGSCGACGCTYGGCVSNHKNPDVYEEHSRQYETQAVSQSLVFQSFKEASQYAKKNPGLKLSRTNDGNGWKIE
jgi:hypothetical protein